jgi:hypothetical protein
MLEVIGAAVAVIEQIVVAVVLWVDGPEFEPQVGIFVGRRFKRINTFVMPVPNNCGGNKFVRLVARFSVFTESTTPTPMMLTPVPG